MAINFPDSPVNGSTYDYGGVRHTYEVTGGTGLWKVLTPGTVGIASAAEIDAGLDGVKYVTALELKNSSYT